MSDHYYWQINSQGKTERKKAKFIPSPNPLKDLNKQKMSKITEDEIQDVLYEHAFQTSRKIQNIPMLTVGSLDETLEQMVVAAAKEIYSLTDDSPIAQARREKIGEFKTLIQKFENKHGVSPSWLRFGHDENTFEGQKLFDHGGYIEGTKVVLLISKSKAYIQEAGISAT